MREHITFFTMKRLYRSKKDRILGGVCAGLGEHLDVDPTVIRLVWAVVTVLSIGTGIIIYILAWIIIPEEGQDTAT
jgi:phage shock protein PspC (stress-responsive transcriptional regulator)